MDDSTRPIVKALALVAAEHFGSGRKTTRDRLWDASDVAQEQGRRDVAENIMDVHGELEDCNIAVNDAVVAVLEMALELAKGGE